MTTVQLQVQITGQDKLNALKTTIDALRSMPPVTIKVNLPQDIDKNISKITAQINAQARLKNINNALQISNNQVAISNDNVRIAIEKTRQTIANAERAQSNATATANRAATAQAKLASQTRIADKAAQKAGLSFGIMGQRIVQAFEWSYAYRLVNLLTTSLRQALETMKAVDDELVTVRKVMSATADEIAGIESRAYDVAAKYGQKPQEYLQGVAAFTRAGYRETAADLAELSTKTQIVGDTTAETANQFLLSVDKAYKYQGSIAKLTAVLDGANEIDNKYATSIERIAEGMGIVAPVASQVHVGVNELAAAIGTITAVTQRTGTEAARALRALFLNIVGDTKTEIDEGVTWTTGEIANLRDVIKTYAPEAVKAAEATGDIINPMEAIAGLSKAMKDNLLTEQQLMETVSDIGGKLRTSQLLALIQNWDMYQSMLKDYAGAIGSADREVENALDSWTRKTTQLSSAWTKFIKNFINGGTVKIALDALIGVINFLDSGTGKLIITLGALYGATRLGIKGFGALTTSLKTAALQFIIGKSAMAALTKEEIAATVASMSLNTTVRALTAAMLQSPLFWVAAGGLAIYGIIKAVDALTVSLDEQREKVRELQSEYDKTYGAGSEYESLKQKATGLTAEEREQLALIESRVSKNEELTEAQKTQLSYLTEQKTQAEGLTSVEETRLAVLEGQKLAAEATLRTQKALEFEKFKEAHTTTIYTNTPDQTSNFGARLTRTTEEAGVQALRHFSDAIAATTKAYREASISADEYNKKIAELVSGRQEYYDELKGYADAGFELTDAMQDFISVYETLATTVGVYGSAVDKSKTTVTQATSAAKLQIIALNNEAGAWAWTTEQVKEYLRYAILAKTLAAEELTEEERAEAALLKGTARDYQEMYDDLVAAEKRAEEVATVTGTGTTTTDGKTELDRLKDIVSLRKAELELLKAKNAPLDEQIAKQREIQAALHKQAEYLRSHGGSQEDIVKLSTEWWNIQNNINKALEDSNKELEAAAKTLKDELDAALKAELEKAKQARDDAVTALDKELDRLKEERDAKKATNELEQKQNDLIEKRIALQNALNERTVRVYNSATGRFEWQADPKKVKSAQDAYDKAAQALSDYTDEQDYNRRVNAIKAQQQAIKDSYSALESELSAINKSLEPPLRTFKEILSDIATRGTPELKAQVDRINSLLSNIGNFSAKAEYTTQNAADISSRAGSGKTVKVNPDGHAPKGLSAGDNVVTGGGTYQITSVNADGTYKSKLVSSSQTTGNYKGSYDVFDGGGILKGIGGIKATGRDEMILPPDITKKMVSAASNATFAKRIGELAYLYGASRKEPSGLKNNIENQHNGDIYELGGITITEGRAKTMTVYDLVQLSKGLDIYKNN